MTHRRITGCVAALLVCTTAFTRAQDYKATWAEYNARVAKGDKTQVPPRRDLERLAQPADFDVTSGYE